MPRRWRIAAPWRRESLGEAIASRTGVDAFATRELGTLQAAMRERGLEVPEAEETWASLVDHLLSKSRAACEAVPDMAAYATSP